MTHRLNRNHFLNLDLHIIINNFSPNEYIEVVNLSGLVVYKGSKQKVEIIVVVIATEWQ